MNDDTEFFSPEYYSEVKVGKAIPDYTLTAYHKERLIDIKLSDYKSKWLILFFYPADFTFVCPTELEEMANFYPEFQKEGAEVLSCSTDTKWVHKAWHDASDAIKKITFPMLADPTQKLSRAFGVYIAEDGVDLRGSFVIDPNGVVQAAEIHADGIGRNAKELLRKLKAAKFVHEHGGAQVCPANWEEGDDTLKPGLDLVGKI